MKRRLVTPEMDERIVALRNQGLTVQQIALVVKLTASGVQNRLMRPENACRITFRWQDANQRTKRSKRNIGRNGIDHHLDEDFE